jgi:type IV secretion system protein VirB3
MDGLDRDLLFVALTRPQMVLGVTYVFLIVNVIVTTELFLVFKSAWVLLAALVIHLVGAAISTDEPRAFDLWRLKLLRTPRIRNHATWRCNSYRP